MKKRYRIPEKYTALFTPVMDLKSMLQSNKDVIDIANSERTIVAFMITHYVTFFISSLAKYNKSINKEQLFFVRNVIEDVLHGDGYTLNELQIRTLISFCDQAAKYVNTTAEIYLTICSYDGYLNYSIYSSLHSDKKIFDFKYFCMVNEDTLKNMKEYYDVAIAFLESVDISKVQLK